MLRPDGSCVYLNEESRCDIYSTRPPFCRVDDRITEHGLDRGIAYQATAALCNAWMREDGIVGKTVQLTVHGRSSP
jgi:Fe-S-cluster containining protein